MSIWSSIFGTRPGSVAPVEIRPSGLLMDADGWYYEESLDSECPHRTIRIQQDRPGDWYVSRTNCRIAELNCPSRAPVVLDFFTGTFRWLRFELENGDANGETNLKIIGTYLDSDGAERESHLGYLEPELAQTIDHDNVDRLWGRIRCIRPPGSGRRPTFCLRFDLLVELEEGLFEEEKAVEARPEDFLPVSS